MVNVEPIPQVGVRTTYAMNHPPLAPLDSRANDRPAAGIMVGGEILDDHIAAATLQEYSRTVLLLADQATPLEVVASKKRVASIMHDSIGAVPLGPDWAQALIQGMENNFAALRREMNENTAALRQEMNENTAALRQEMNENNAALRQEMNEINAALRQEMNENNATQWQALQLISNGVTTIRNDLFSLSIQTMRNINRSRLRTELIVPIPNQHGAPLPPDLLLLLQSDFVLMEEQDVDALLNFYNILAPQQETLDAKKRLLCAHLGVIYA